MLTILVWSEMRKGQGEWGKTVPKKVENFLFGYEKKSNKLKKLIPKSKEKQQQPKKNKTKQNEHEI